MSSKTHQFWNKNQMLIHYQKHCEVMVECLVCYVISLNQVKNPELLSQSQNNKNSQKTKCNLIEKILIKVFEKTEDPRSGRAHV